MGKAKEQLVLTEVYVLMELLYDKPIKRLDPFRTQHEIAITTPAWGQP